MGSGTLERYLAVERTTRAADYRHGIRSHPMFVSDLGHFLDLPDDVPGEARRMADRLSRVVRAGTASDAGVRFVSALRCWRRPGRAPCPGHIEVFRTDVPASIDWRCTSCGDDGVISGWTDSPFDLRATKSSSSPGEVRRVIVSEEVAPALRELLFLGSEVECMVFGAAFVSEGVALVGTEDDFDELLGSVAAEANHEGDRRRRRRLGDAYETLVDVLEP